MNQHYVPRCYLKNFAEKKGKEFFIDVYDQKEDRYFKANIKKICSEIDFYTLNETNSIGNDLLIIEKMYANGFEPLYPKAYNLLTNKNVFHLSDLQRGEILLAIFQFYIRNPNFLNRIIATHKNSIKSLYDNAKRINAKGMTYLEEDFSFREYELDAIMNFFEKKAINEFKEKHLSGLREISNFHEHAKFEVIHIGDNSEFISSDNPLIMEDMVTNDFRPLLRTKAFFIALNKTTVLKIHHDNGRLLNRIYRCNLPNGSVAIINNSIIAQSTRFLFTKKHILEEQRRITKDVLDNTSTELKINMFREILAKFKKRDDNDTSYDLTRYYVDKYDKEGNISDAELYHLYQTTRSEGIEFIKKITK